MRTVLAIFGGIVLSGCATHIKYNYNAATPQTLSSTLSQQTEFKTMHPEASRQDIMLHSRVAMCNSNGKAAQLTNPVLKDDRLCGDTLVEKKPFRVTWGDQSQCIATKNIVAIGTPYTQKKTGILNNAVVLDGCSKFLGKPKSD